MNYEFFNKLYLAFIDDPTKSILLAFTALFLTAMGWYLSAYVKEKAKSKASNSKNPKKRTNESVVSSEIQKDKEEHFPTVTFTDGIIAAVQITLTYRIFNAKKYVYESNDPIGILSNLVDARSRQFLEQFSMQEALEKRRKAEYELKHDLEDEFLKYGIDLKSITIGSIQATN